MEEEFLSLGLDIIGLGVFNYDFGSITRESPVIKARRRGPGCGRARAGVPRNNRQLHWGGLLSAGAVEHLTLHPYAAAVRSQGLSLATHAKPALRSAQQPAGPPTRTRSRPVRAHTRVAAQRTGLQWALRAEGAQGDGRAGKALRTSAGRRARTELLYQICARHLRLRAAQLTPV